MEPRTVHSAQLRLGRLVPATLLGGIVLAAMGGCDGARGSPRAGPGPEPAFILVKLVRPSRQDIIRRVDLPATTRANYMVTLYSKVTGYLKEITKDRGDRVKAGELIALLEIPEMVAEIAHARANFALENTTFNRLEAIRKVEKSAVTDQDLDLARAKRDMAEATLKKLQTMLEYTEIRAPFDGYVTERFVDPGAFIQQGKIVSMVDTSTVRVLVDVPESEVRFASAGTPAEIHFDALPGKSILSKISRTAGDLDPVARTMRVEMDVSNPDLTLLPGMFAHAELLVDRHPNALVVPAQAVTVQQDRSFLFINAGGTAKKVFITLGAHDGTWCEAVSGLRGDEAIILPEGKPVMEGLPVRSTEGT
jgi:membrane fusion protein (multidrug efflux system)